MRGNNNYSFLILLYFLILHILRSSSCIDKCGDIKIPFPFGIGNGCYLDEWYEIVCKKNASSGKEFPFLFKIKMEVVNISLPINYDGYANFRLFSSIRVKSPISSVGCSSDGAESGSPLNLTDSPFFFGDGNSLVAVGCNNKASLTNVETRMVGCQSTCTTSNNSQSIPFFETFGCSSRYQGMLPTNYIPVCNTTKKREETICNGNGCCQASAPAGGQQVIGVTIANINDGNLTTGGECKVAFLTDEVYTLANATKPELFLSEGHATVSLGWFIQTKNLSFRELLGCQNKDEFDNTQLKRRTAKCTCDNHTISRTSYASCACLKGYRGNPYLRDDCKGK
ncbi:unnamed protein product [Arabidopsis arenosa]|uniref:Wall-associated receptor kinase n=1 Tax=Arabidopsis arenosa TaxID=38785 RepID=A0A8S1ZE79_ARAAE|nr:unnamed protein product [Arabidopsis arenosa]